MGHPQSLFLFIFGLFQTSINTIFQQINVKKCPSSIWYRDFNPQISEREFPPITTRPGLPPLRANMFTRLIKMNSSSFLYEPPYFSSRTGLPQNKIWKIK